VVSARVTCTEAPRAIAPAALARRDPHLGLVVHLAASGDERAWAQLHTRFDATVRSVARRYGLSPADRDDVAQRTWLILVRHIGRLRTHPAVAGWLVTTARRECLKVLAANHRELPHDDPMAGREPESEHLDEGVLAAERREALRHAVADVPAHEQRLMQLLLRDPDLSYDEISTTLGIPKGSIGPTRGRCFARLREDRRLCEVVRP
jgi:RNA polymerase sigma factor (sigma-70 family)